MYVTQVLFKDPEGEMNTGICIDNKYVICGCCGSVFDEDDIDFEWICHLPWIDISDAIKGD